MSDGPNNQGRTGNLRKYGWPALVILFTTLLLFGAAWLLWATDDSRAQGAAITLVGVAASHLVKEVQQLLKSWLEDK